MNREHAETILRLLAEAELRDQLAPDPPPWAGGPGAGRVKVYVVGQALSAVGPRRPGGTGLSPVRLVAAAPAGR